MNFLKQFAAQVERQPDAIAIVSDPGDRYPRLTYKELDNLSTHYAHFLQKKVANTATCKDIFICYLPRSTFVKVLELAALKAGVTFAILNPEEPVQKNRRIIEAVCPSCIITNSELQRTALFDGVDDVADGIKIVDLNFVDVSPSTQPVQSRVTDESATAYIVFSSGTSTGEPKGIRMSYHQMDANVTSLDDVLRKKLPDRLYQDYCLGPGARIAQTAPIDFDASFYEELVGLTYGATVYLVPQDVVGVSAALCEYLVTHQISHLVYTPTNIRNLLQQPGVAKLRLKVLCSMGERLPVELAEALKTMVGVLINGTGPSETGISSSLGIISIYDLQQREPIFYSGEIHVGKPRTGLQYIVLPEVLSADELRKHLEANSGKTTRLQCPTKEPGELWIVGKALGRYIGAASVLNADKFVTHAGLDYYRTGDRCRRSQFGFNITGKLDGIVKVGGKQVNLEGIEAYLKQHQQEVQPYLGDCIFYMSKVPIKYERGKRFSHGLCLNIFARGIMRGNEIAPEYRNDTLNAAVLLLYDLLERRGKPQEMPAFVRFIPNIQANSRGKLSRDADFPGIELQCFHEFNCNAAMQALAVTPPRNRDEQLVLKHWAQFFDIPAERISVFDSFFNLGGTSVVVADMLNSLAPSLYDDHLPITLSEFYNNPTIAGLAAHAGLQRLTPGKCPAVTKDQDIIGNPTGEKVYVFCLPTIFGETEAEHRLLISALAASLKGQRDTPSIQIFYLKPVGFAARSMRSLHNMTALKKYYFQLIDKALNDATLGNHVHGRTKVVLYGWSSAGIIADELASDLAGSGRLVSVLLNDTVAPHCNSGLTPVQFYHDRLLPLLSFDPVVARYPDISQLTKLPKVLHCLPKAKQVECFINAIKLGLSIAEDDFLDNLASSLLLLAKHQPQPITTDQLLRVILRANSGSKTEKNLLQRLAMENAEGLGWQPAQVSVLIPYAADHFAMVSGSDEPLHQLAESFKKGLFACLKNMGVGERPASRALSRSQSRPLDMPTAFDELFDVASCNLNTESVKLFNDVFRRLQQESDETMSALFKHRNSNGFTLLQLLLANTSRDAPLGSKELMKMVLDDTRFEDQFYTSRPAGLSSTTLQITISQEGINDYAFELILSLIKRDPAKLLRFSDGQSISKHNLLLWVAHHPCIDVTQKVIASIFELLQDDVALLWKYFSETDVNRRNIIWMLCQAGREEVLNELIQLLQQKFTTEQITALLCQPDSVYNLTPLALACITSISVRTISLMLLYGASKNINEKSQLMGKRALDFVITFPGASREELLKLLADYQASTDCTALANCRCPTSLVPAGPRHADISRQFLWLCEPDLKDDGFVRFIKRYIATYTAEDRNNNNILLVKAIWDGKFKRVIDLLEKVSFNDFKCLFNGYSVLHIAARCSGCDEEIFKLLLKMKNCDVNDRDPQGFTVFCEAAFQQRTALVGVLLEWRDAAVDYNVTTNQGDTAISLAMYKGHQTVVLRILQSQKISVEKLTAPNRQNLTPFHFAALHGCFEVIQKLAKQTSDHSDQCCDGLGYTPLHFAALRNDINCVESLCSINRNLVSVFDPFGKLPIDLCTSKECCSLLKEAMDIYKRVNLGVASPKPFAQLSQSASFDSFRSPALFTPASPLHGQTSDLGSSISSTPRSDLSRLSLRSSLGSSNGSMDEAQLFQLLGQQFFAIHGGQPANLPPPPMQYDLPTGPEDTALPQRPPGAAQLTNLFANGGQQNAPGNSPPSAAQASNSTSAFAQRGEHRSTVSRIPVLKKKK